MRLLLRAMLAVIAVGLLPLAVAWWMLTGINREAMTKQVLRTHAVAASTAARRIAAFNDARMATARSVAATEAIAADASSDTSRELLQSLLQGDENLAAISIVAPSGEERIRVQRKETAGEMPRVLAAQAGAFTVVRDAQLWLVASAPVAGGGEVRVVANGAALEAAVQAKELGQEAQIAVVSRDRLLFGAARSIGEFPAKMRAVSRDGHVDGSGVYGEGSASVIGAFATVAGTDWIVLSRQPATIARAVEAEMRRGSLSAAAIALALTAVVTILAWLTVVRPLRRLAEAQRKVVGTMATTGDEIAQLRNGVAVLERRKSDHENLGRAFLGRYEVLDLLGEGGMGTVFRGWDPRLQRMLALKTIRFEGAVLERDALVESLVREAVTIARFSHPHIVSVFDVEETPQGAYVAMELVDGVNLERYLHAKGLLTSDETVLLGLAIADALATAHKQGLVHRDIKPPNVLLGREGAIKVSDFGLAELVTSVPHGAGFVFGTPGYIAPECVSGGPATAASDIFSLGVLLYDCITAHHPFEAETVAITFQATMHLDPPPPSFHNSRVDPELDALILELMHKAPASRPHSDAVVSRLASIVARRNLRWTFTDPATLPGSSGTSTLRMAV